MNDWQIALSIIGSQILVILGFLKWVWKPYHEEVGKLRNDVAWANKDLAEVKKDVEWLVWHFKEGPEK
ncbi:MAG: hypothetical protein F4Z87_07285 [Gammaproteobacteria bacterium]|nr:hypothetical protein [Gammaproteobacteria bacterium]